LPAKVLSLAFGLFRAFPIIGAHSERSRQGLWQALAGSGCWVSLLWWTGIRSRPHVAES
jgi:hypothetical protein